MAMTLPSSDSPLIAVSGLQSIQFPDIEIFVSNGSPVRLAEHAHAEPQVSIRQSRVIPAQSSVSIVPAWRPHSGGWSADYDLTVVRIAPAIISSAAVDLCAGSRFELKPVAYGQDPFLQHLGHLMRTEASRLTASPSTHLFLDALANALSGYLLRTYSEIESRRLPSRGLAPAQLRKLTSFIDDNLEQDLRIRDIAALLGMLPQSFSRSFRLSMGCSPYTYILQRRVDRARYLLRGSTLSLAEIALKVGFANQSHFTDVFRRHTGITPQRWRLL